MPIMTPHIAESYLDYIDDVTWQRLVSALVYSETPRSFRGTPTRSSLAWVPVLASTGSPALPRVGSVRSTGR
jgi:hypothetical protein